MFLDSIFPLQHHNVLLVKVAHQVLDPLGRRLLTHVINCKLEPESHEFPLGHIVMLLATVQVLIRLLIIP